MGDTLFINVNKAYGAFDLSVTEEIALSGTTALFGPSGSGKSTLLRLIAGFATPDSGVIKFNDEVWSAPKVRVPAHKRPIGYMFQSGALFSHLTVAGNLNYSVKRNPQSDLKFDAVIDALGIDDLMPRKVAGLSGGERQRVALARTLLRGPRLLLLDEPLAALDRARKREILPFLKRLPTEFQIPCLYVSHDIDEVSQLADHLLLIDNGKITQRGTALSLLSEIETGQDETRGTVFEMRFCGYNKDTALSTLALGQVKGAPRIEIPAQVTGDTDDLKRVRIAAKDVAIARIKPEGLSIRNALPATIEDVSFGADTPFAVISLRLKNAPLGTPLLRARITRASTQELQLGVGQSVFALVKSVSFAMNLL